MAGFVGFALAGACLLFVLSLPLGKAPVAGALRRWAGVLFVLALGPSLFVGISGGAGLPSSGGGIEAADVLAAIGGIGLLSLAAFAALQVRGRFRRGNRDAMSDYFSQRSTGKRPVERDDEPRGGVF